MSLIYIVAVGIWLVTLFSTFTEYGLIDYAKSTHFMVLLMAIAFMLTQILEWAFK